MADPLASVILRNTELVEATKDSLAVRGLTLTEATVDHPADQMMAYDALYDSDFVKATLDLQDLPLHGPVHQQLLNVGFTRAHILNPGTLRGDTGNTSGRIHASRGIGKSTVLRRLVPLLHIVFPNVIPVYISLQDSVKKDHFLHERDMCEEIVHQLRLDQHQHLLGPVALGAARASSPLPLVRPRNSSSSSSTS